MNKRTPAWKKKYLKVGAVVTAVVLSTTTAVAATSSQPAPSGSDNNQLVAAIQALGKEIKAIALAKTQSTSNRVYQNDNNLAVAMQANTGNPSVGAQTQQQSQEITKRQINDSLLQFPEAVVTPSQLSDPQLTQEINQRKQLLTRLTTQTPAKDTLYLTADSDALASLYGVSKPNQMLDNYFNFDSLFAPSAYNAAQQSAAQAYLQYATKQYQSYTDGISFDKLKSTLNNLGPKDKAQALQTFINNPDYQKYQLMIRSLLASKSAALSNLNALLAERTPVKGLATQTGLPNDPSLPVGDASPLQVENYVANERLSNSQWYQQMKTASPATVGREQVLILAEIESELQRNHLDQERLIAILSLSALQSNQFAEMALQQQEQKVNNAIDALNNSGNNSTSLNTNN
ncbi:MAG: hypothetical protein A3F41_05150 [Coxiella sp. RIFCSPHIGHO2_12_FULL_44_14]|nr:MAG: hypothetical protein A3F41_05150 [Coxiella sp. RIFCSPHIGHO2_12_FULL_44_14]